MKPRKFSTRDRERFGGTSRAASRSSGFVDDLGSEPGDKLGSASKDGSSSVSASGLAVNDPSREPVADEHWEITVGESNKTSGPGTTPTCSTLVMQSNASVGGALPGCTLRVALAA